MVRAAGMENSQGYWAERQAPIRHYDGSFLRLRQ